MRNKMTLVSPLCFYTDSRLPSFHPVYICCFCKIQLMLEYHPPSFGLPHPLLYGLTLAASLIYSIFLTELRKKHKNRQNWKGCNKFSQDADSGV